MHLNVLTKIDTQGQVCVCVCVLALVLGSSEYAVDV